MASLRTRKDTGQLLFDFRWQGARYRVPTDLQDDPQNRQALDSKLKLLNQAIIRGAFCMDTFFPESGASAHQADAPARPRARIASPAQSKAPTPLFAVFAEQWFTEFHVEWRNTYV